MEQQLGILVAILAIVGFIIEYIFKPIRNYLESNRKKEEGVEDLSNVEAEFDCQGKIKKISFQNVNRFRAEGIMEKITENCIIPRIPETVVDQKPL